MLEIIYQDAWLVAVNKPSGWLVHRSSPSSLSNTRSRSVIMRLSAAG